MYPAGSGGLGEGGSGFVALSEGVLHAGEGVLVPQLLEEVDLVFGQAEGLLLLHLARFVLQSLLLFLLQLSQLDQDVGIDVVEHVHAVHDLRDVIELPLVVGQHELVPQVGAEHGGVPVGVLGHEPPVLVYEVDGVGGHLTLHLLGALLLELALLHD